MASSFSPNRNLELQATGENQGSWGTRANADFSILDSILGAVTALTITNVNVTLSTSQSQCMFLRLTGTQTGNVDITWPATGGAFWVDNQVSGSAYTVTIKSAGAGRSVVAPRGQKTYLFSDGTNIDPVQTLPGTWCGDTAGSSTVYTVTMPGNITALTTGLAIFVKWDETCGATPTLNASSLGAKALYKPGVGGPVALAANDAQAGVSSLLVYDAALAGGSGAWLVLTGIVYVQSTRSIATGTGLSGGGDLSADRTIILANTAVTPAAYGSTTAVATFTVDAQGRLTAAGNAAISVTGALGYTPANKAGDTFSGAVNVSGAFNVSVGTTAPGGVTSTEGGAAKAPFKLFRDSGSPLASDLLMSLSFAGRSSTLVERTYAEILAQIKTTTNTLEDALLVFRTIIGGAEADRFLIGAGLYASGLADMGTQTVNALNFYKSGTVLPLQQKFTSAYQAIPAAGGLLQVAHGFSAAPDPSLVFAVMKNVSGGTVAGWADGDTFRVPLQQFDGGSTNIPGGSVVYTDATNINVRRCSTGSFTLILNKSSGLNTTMTDANWNVSLIAFA